ncbi:MAG: hypothetical protein IBX50_17650, partial [Marinospirillum sp.]|uniref:hypothetical protein n=1 Tax=Marinospirillum sp. TaxID=2183934 RepID=UPI0019E40CB3
EPSTVEAVKKAHGCTNCTLPAIEIYRGEDDFFAFQEHEAEALLEQAKELILDLGEAAETQLDVEDVLLSQAQEW